MEQELYFRRNRHRKILICCCAAVLVTGVIGSILASRQDIHEELEVWGKEVLHQNQRHSPASQPGPTDEKEEPSSAENQKTANAGQSSLSQ